MPEFDSTVEYRDIPGFPGYMLGSDGSFWSNREKGRRYKADPNTPLTGIWKRRKTPIMGPGYPTITVRDDGGKQFLFTLHRLILEVFIGPCPKGKWACHFPDPTKTNCRLENLRWGTPKENGEDSVVQGVIPKGERNGHARLTTAIVRQCRLRHSQGAGVTQLAREFNVRHATMGEAIRRLTWRHVI